MSIFILSNNFFGWLQGHGSFWYFHVDLLIFLIQKLLMSVGHVLVSGWRSCHLNYVFDAIQWPKPTFHCLFGCVTMSSSTSCGVWWYTVVGLSLMIVFFSFFSLSCQIKCTIVFFIFCFSISIFTLFISYFILITFIEVLFFNLFVQI